MVLIRKTLTASLVCLAGCSCARRTTRSNTDEPRPPAPVVSARPAASSTPKTTPTPDPCPALKPNEVSADETPAIAGASGRIKAGDWLLARGISKAAFRSWVRSRAPGKLEDFDGDSIFDTEDGCETLTVGDRSEDALVCTLAVRTSIMRYSAVVFVVRNRRIAPVLEVGYSLPAMDWPDTSWLD